MILLTVHCGDREVIDFQVDLGVHYLESNVLVGVVEQGPPTMGRNLSQAVGS
jgi:hypothetical protein